MQLKPREFADLTPAQYVMICIGHKQRKLNAERSERQLNWMIYSSFGDPKKMPKSASAWWPIDGEPKQRKPRIPSRDKILLMHEQFIKLGKKNG